MERKREWTHKIAPPGESQTEGRDTGEKKQNKRMTVLHQTVK